MKTTLLFLSLLFVPFFLYAQNYELINVNNETHFIDDESDIYSIRIDSTSTIDGNTFLFNHKVFTETFSVSCPFIASDSSWIGYQIIVDNDGQYIFFNRQQDSIFIPSLAELNEHWSFYQFANGDYIDATISSIDNQMILGDLDNVKTITLQAKNDLDMDIDHPVNGQSISFSENNGIVSVFNFIDFPLDIKTYTLVGSANSANGIQNLTAREIFDYDIGDEFHVERNYQNNWKYTYRSIRKKILGKTVSLNQDTLNYIVEQCEFRIQNEDPLISPDTLSTLDTLTETIILSNYNLHQLTLEPVVNGYTEFSISQTHNRRKKTHFDYNYNPDDDCWEELVVTYDFDFTFIEGLGGGYFSTPASNYTLVYYKKGDEEWGTPFECSPLPTSIANLEKEHPQISVYPNPFSKQTRLTIEDYKFGERLTFELFEMTGKKIYYTNINQPSFVIHKENLLSGLYFYKISNTKKRTSFIGKLMVE